MELWFALALISMVAAGFLSFIFKMAAAHGHSGGIVMAYVYGVMGLWSTGVIWYFDIAFSDDWLVTIGLGVFVGVGIALSNIAKIASLKNIDSAIFFPIYKALGPIAITVIGIVAFAEQFTLFESIGIVAGITVPLLLLHKSEKSRQNNLQLGLIFMLVAIFFSIITVVAQKIVSDSGMSLWLFLMTAGYAGAVASVLVHLYRERDLSTNRLINPQLLLLGLVGGVLEVTISYTFMRALEGGQVAIVYTIVSFYLLIPIVLSVWFYQEHMNMRKAFAIGLSILAIIFFKY